MSVDRLLRAALLLGTAFFAGTGAWALLDPSSFYEQLATFPPYNRHFLHDAGAFELGLAAALLLGLAGWSGVRVALWGAAAAAVLHAVAHIVDRDLGGRGSDPVTLAILAAVLLAAAGLSLRTPRA